MLDKIKPNTNKIIAIIWMLSYTSKIIRGNCSMN